MDSFEGFDLERRIRERASRVDLDLDPDAVSGLAMHARRVLEENARLHLTTIVTPVEFLERHLGEAFEGAAMIDADAEGMLVDLGSGNGYPGLPVAAARARLVPCLVEASIRKAAFLSGIVEAIAPGGCMLGKQVQRGTDLSDVTPIRVVTCRAMGDWERVIPRLHSSGAEQCEVLLWAGQEVEAVSRRVAWKRLEVIERRALRGRDRSWVWRIAFR